MFVWIVTEVCVALGFLCRCHVSIFSKFWVGDEQICIVDIVEAFKEGTMPYRSPNTFKNYHALKLNAEVLLNNMERDGLVTSAQQIWYITLARELLVTPLNKAIDLGASWYRKIKTFKCEVKMMANSCNFGAQLEADPWICTSLAIEKTECKVVAYFLNTIADVKI